jgi:hypothetical protein
LRRNCLLKRVSIEVTGTRGRRLKQILDDLKETRGYWKLKEDIVDRILWRTRFGRGCGPADWWSNVFLVNLTETNRHLP